MRSLISELLYLGLLKVATQVRLRVTNCNNVNLTEEDRVRVSLADDLDIQRGQGPLRRGVWPEALAQS